MVKLGLGVIIDNVGEQFFFLYRKDNKTTGNRSKLESLDGAIKKFGWGWFNSKPRPERFILTPLA